MARKASHLNAYKVTPKPKLAAIIGKKPVSYSQASKKLWNSIHKLGLQGEKDDGYSVKYGKKKYIGGQVIHCGEDPDWKKLCGGKNRIAMVEIGKLVKKHSIPPK